MSFQSINLGLINLILGTLQPDTQGTNTGPCTGGLGTSASKVQGLQNNRFYQEVFSLFFFFALTGGPDQVGSYFTETEAGNHE